MFANNSLSLFSVNVPSLFPFKSINVIHICKEIAVLQWKINNNNLYRFEA